jgi:hypothetical protein
LKPEGVSVEDLLHVYLRSLAAKCNRLPLPVVDPRFLRAGGGAPVPLSEVYVALDVRAPPRDEEGREERISWGRLARAQGGERTPLIEAFSHPQKRHFVLLGDAGSGKTTFVDYLTHALATGVPLDPPLDGMLPVRLVLRRAAARCIPADARRGEAAMLWHALRAELEADLGGEAAQRLFAALREQLLVEGGLFLLDGLDEVPDAVIPLTGRGERLVLSPTYVATIRYLRAAQERLNRLAAIDAALDAVLAARGNISRAATPNAYSKGPSPSPAWSNKTRRRPPSVSCTSRWPAARMNTSGRHRRR